MIPPEKALSGKHKFIRVVGNGSRSNRRYGGAGRRRLGWMVRCVKSGRCGMRPRFHSLVTSVLRGSPKLNFVRSTAAVLAALVAGSAAAQAVTPTPRLEVERLQLDPSARGSLVVGTGEVALRGSFRAAAAGQREHLPLVLVGPSDYLGRRSDSAATEVIGDRDTLHLVLDYVVLPASSSTGASTSS